MINGTADLQAGSQVTATCAPTTGRSTGRSDAVVTGSVRSFEANVAAFALLLIPLILVLFVGIGIAAIAVALLVAAFGARQVRHAESLISNETGTVLVAGLIGSFVLPILAVLLTITIVGAPFGLGALLIVLPALAFLGWIVAAIWVGDWILGRSGGPRAERPYAAAVVGVIVLALAGIVPFVSAIATLFGFGALLLIAWRILRPPTATVELGRLGPAAAQRELGETRLERRTPSDATLVGAPVASATPVPPGVASRPDPGDRVAAMSGTAGFQDPATTVARPADLLRAFLRSPFQAATWLATIAIVIGLGVTILSVAALSVCFSTGGSLLIWLVGIPIIALGIEVSRLFARVERWRMTLVDPRPLVAHAYQPLNGWPRAPYGAWLRTWAEAQFLDANRWRDVVYVLVLLPLGILEFVVAIGFWLTAFAPARGRR